MNCPKCKSTDISQDRTHAHDLGIVCVCVECESTWIAGEEKQTFCDGDDRRAMQRQIDGNDLQRQINNRDDFEL